MPSICKNEANEEHRAYHSCVSRQHTALLGIAVYPYENRRKLTSRFPSRGCGQEPL
jgi:hypothetical protein